MGRAHLKIDELEASIAAAETDLEKTTAKGNLKDLMEAKEKMKEAKASGDAAAKAAAAKELTDSDPWDYSDRVMGHSDEPPKGGGMCTKKRSRHSQALNTLPGM